MDTNKKLVLEYQITDERGNPIARLTHFEAATEAELREKLIKAHTEVSRALHRLKTQIRRVVSA